MPATPAARQLVDLAKGFALVEFYPLVHPTPTQALIDLANTLLAGGEVLVVRVSADGAVAGAPRSHHVERFGRRLAEHGVHQLALRHDAGPDSLGRALSAVALPPRVARAAGGLAAAMSAAGAARVAVDGEWTSPAHAAGDAGVAPSASPAEAGIELWSAHDMYQQVRDSASRVESEDTAELRRLLRTGTDGERLQVLGRLEFLGQYYFSHHLTEQGIELVEALRRDAEEMRGRDPATRSMVMLALNRLASRAVVDELVRRLGRARSEEERAGLRATLVHVGADTVTPLVRELTDASEAVARRAYRDTLVALDHVGVPLLEEMVGDERWFVVRNMVGILGDTRSPDAIEHFRRTIEHADARVRRETVQALSKVGGDEAVPLLAKALNDAEAPLRASAALGLGLTKLPAAAGPLLTRLAAEEDGEVELEIVRALGRIGDPRAVEPLAARAKGGGFFSRVPAALRAEAVRALGEIGGDGASALLRKLAGDRNGAVAEAARKALG